MAVEHPQDVLLYWNFKTASDILQKETDLDYVTSDQLVRVISGDTVWVATVYNSKLYLLGKLIVDEVTSKSDAIKKLGRSNLWGDKDYFALAPKDNIEPLKRILLNSLIDRVEFRVGKDIEPKLLLGDNKVNPQRLQTMRILTDSSVGTLQQIWNRH